MYSDTWHTPLVTHLVFVDGRLVESWQEPATGTEWGSHVRPPAPPPAPPPPPLHEQVHTWLAEVCGGRAAVDGLGVEPLDDDAIDLPVEYPQAAQRQRMEATAELLDSVATRLFDREMSYAFRHALLALWADDPESVTRAATAAHLAAGICWAVGKANGAFHPVGTRRVGTIQDAFALRSPASSYGNVVAATLRGFLPRADRWARPVGVPELEPLGRADLLTGATRERLVRLRDRARAAAAAA
ncbi:hypothetical protein ASC77_18145 [Nocardioides sp. Root1257]|uniref:hypothetical protein n=1 Tax=unclassified Nocardioides TaxID=2615069 RepID=UPI0006FC6616|nr:MULTISPECIES: hypothetical protein [unclassified Nocardioides]KQW47100.1 hypothetical protein ASC77_18145 [Nocardioides sp. Root1257]KRC43845.1 hypothetical protein ASE24_19100 [Nocardioides sp. Root224]